MYLVTSRPKPSLQKEYQLILKAVRKYKKQISDNRKKLEKAEKLSKSEHYGTRQYYEDEARSLKRHIKWDEETVKKWMAHLRRIKKLTSETKGQRIGRRVMVKSAMEISRSKSKK